MRDVEFVRAAHERVHRSLPTNRVRLLVDDRVENRDRALPVHAKNQGRLQGKNERKHWGSVEHDLRKRNMLHSGKRKKENRACKIAIQSALCKAYRNDVFVFRFKRVLLKISFFNAFILFK